MQNRAKVLDTTSKMKNPAEKVDAATMAIPMKGITDTNATTKQKNRNAVRPRWQLTEPVSARPVPNTRRYSRETLFMAKQATPIAAPKPKTQPN